MSWISCLALSIPSLVPVIFIISEFSSERGVVILVAVDNSMAFNLLPPLPSMNLWCSFGMRSSTCA